MANFVFFLGQSALLPWTTLIYEKCLKIGQYDSRYSICKAP